VELAAAPVGDFDLPSVRAILATHRNSPGPRPAVERQRRSHVAVPTVPLEPGQWALPGWLAVPPAGIAALGIGVVACVLSWWWAIDASNASVVTHRLMAVDGAGRRRRLPDELRPPGGKWIKTTAQHLAHWAVHQSGAEPDEAAPATDAAEPLTRALEISPLNPTARLAMSQLEGSGRDGKGRIRGLGLSRDSVSLAWSARRLMDSGKKDASLRLYRRALSAAAEGGLSRSVTPRFAEDEAARRVYYLLPSEDAVRDIVDELATRDGLEFREWSKALPHHPIVLLATARILRERGMPEADALLDRILGDEWDAAGQGTGNPRLLAARGEAFMLRSRWPEAAEHYRLAIERVDNDLIRRSWWFNLADIAQRLDDEGLRQAAWRAALAVNISDDISRRVGLLQKAGDAKPRPRPGYGTARAN
jgi:tetratricopeptide (TPR) repeat protein